MRSKKHYPDINVSLCKESKQSKERVISARFIERLYECPFCANRRPFLNKARLIKSSQPCHVQMKRKKTREHKHSPLSIAWMKQLTASERGFWKCINGDESEAVVEVTTKSGVSRTTCSDIPYIRPDQESDATVLLVQCSESLCLIFYPLLRCVFFDATQDKPVMVWASLISLPWALCSHPTSADIIFNHLLPGRSVQPCHDALFLMCFLLLLAGHLMELGMWILDI